MTATVAEALLVWYAARKRQLPWRGSRDPYVVWVSEVMLQQTRVETVRKYFERWMIQFPTIESLAAAPVDAVLQQWEGLGYYRRAHNLHAAACKLVSARGGRIPATTAELRQLPGVGKYTAAAIAAIAFGEDEIALDGNLRRVLARLLDLEVDPRSAAGERRLLDGAMQLLPPGRASDFNQALMDLGATICLPRDPTCHTCPLANHCLAFGRDVVAERPVRRKKPPIPHHMVAAGVIEREGKVLIARRPLGGLLGGLWEFPGGKVEPGESLRACLLRELKEELGVKVEARESVGTFTHAYTHFRVTVHAFMCRLTDGTPESLEHSQLTWVDEEALAEYPMGKIDRLIAHALAGS